MSSLDFEWQKLHLVFQSLLLNKRQGLQDDITNMTIFLDLTLTKTILRSKYYSVGYFKRNTAEIKSKLS